MVGVSIRDIEKLKKLVYSDFVSGKKRQLVDFVKGKARQAAEITNKKRLQEIMMEGWKPKSHKKAVKYVDKKRAEGKKSKSSFKPSPKRPPRAENPEETKQLFGIAKKRKEEFARGGSVKGTKKSKYAKLKKSLKQYAPKGLGKLSGIAFYATAIPSIPEHLKRVKRAGVMKKQRKASIKHIGKKETYSGKIAAAHKTKKIIGRLGYYFGTYPERRNILGFKYKTGKTDEGNISAIRKSLRRLPIKHLKTFGKGGLVKPKSARIATRGWGKVIK